MRYSIAASSLLGLAIAAPQNIDVNAALAVPTPSILGPSIEDTKPVQPTYNPVAAASAVAAVVKSEGAILKRDQAHDLHIATTRKRNACDAQPLGNGPTISPDTAAAFSSSAELSGTARGASTPSGYQQAFVDQSGSSQQIGYLTYKTYQTYDVQGCADACDGEKYCLGFNIYFERDPSLEPGPDCPNPSSTTNIMCNLYGYPVAAKAATNTGQWRQDFQVVIAGSNGYTKTNKALPSVQDFKAPTSLPATINAPLDNGYDTYAGMRLFNDNPFDPALCAAACESQTDYASTHPDSEGHYKPCNFFTTYILTQNGVPLGTYCAFYTRSWDSSYATNTGYYYGDDKYEVIDAGSYEITSPNTGGNGSPASSPSSSSSTATSQSTSSSTSPSPSSSPSPSPSTVDITPSPSPTAISTITTSSAETPSSTLLSSTDTTSLTSQSSSMISISSSVSSINPSTSAVTSTPSATPTPTGLLADAGFEETATASVPWTIKAGLSTSIVQYDFMTSSSVSAPHSGAQSGSITYVTNAAPYQSWFNQPVTLKANAAYTFSAYIKYSTNTPAPASCNVFFYLADSTGSGDIRIFSKTLSTAMATNWQQVTANIVNDATVSSTFNVRLTCNGIVRSRQTYYFDDISLVAA